MQATPSENEDFWQRDLEVCELYYYYVIIKTWTMFFRLVVCVHMQSFKWFHSIILKIYTIFQYVKMLCKPFDVIDHLIWILHKSKYFKNLDYVYTVSFSLAFYIVLRPQGIRKQMKMLRKGHRVHIA